MVRDRSKSGWLVACLLMLVLVVRIVTALPLEQPGYMDAYYYYNVADSLYRGEGFTDHVLWNFLDDPVGLPYPACLYWMPLTSIIIYPFLLVFGASFRAAQIPFVLLSVLLAWMAFRVSMDLSGKRSQASLAACLVAFSGFYTVFWVTTDTFILFAVTAGLALYAAGRGIKAFQPGWFALSGGCAALAHLTRADGVLVLLCVCAALLIAAWKQPGLRGRAAVAGLLAVLVYLVVMAPWFYRNWQVVGSPLGAGGLQTLFLRDYDELYSYGHDLSLPSYLDWGWHEIVRSKLEGVWVGVQNLLVVNLLIFLAPLSAWGLWTWRRKPELLPFALYAAALYAVMSLLFTFPGMRGGLFHSSAALLPWLFAAAACGLEKFVAFMTRRRRGWNSRAALLFFRMALIALAFSLSAFLFWRSVYGGLPWNDRNTVYLDVGNWLDYRDYAALSMVNNAPGFHYFTGRSAISIPHAELEVVLDAAQRYGVRYLVLEADHPRSMRGLYEGGQTDPRLHLEENLSDSRGSPVKIYRLEW